MVNEVAAAVKAAGDNAQAQYDASAKRLFSQKIVLANILAGTVEEFFGMEPTAIVDLIEGDPCIGSVPLEPGLTNKAFGTPRIGGLNTEDSVPDEGVIYFDILFYVRLKDGISQIIVNVEIQRARPGYSLEGRGLYYADRLVSSQKGRDFVNSNYDDIKQVYSIWLCLNAPEASVTRYRYFKEKLVSGGDYEIVGPISMSTVIFIWVTNEVPEATEDNRMQRLLSILVSNKLTVAERLALLFDEYGITDMYIGIEKEVKDMCNLGAALVEETAIATTHKAAEDMILSLSREGLRKEQIIRSVAVLGISKEELGRIYDRLLSIDDTGSEGKS